jgi:hypothetical protein
VGVGRASSHGTLHGNRVHADGRIEFREWSASLHIVNERYADFTVWHLNMRVIEETTVDLPRMTLWHRFISGERD